MYDTIAAEVTAAVQLARPERRDDLMPTVAQEWMQQGRAEGLLAGEAKGKAEMLLRLMRRRFGALPADVETRVRNAGADTLDTWSERILDAGSVADLFDDSREH